MPTYLQGRNIAHIVWGFAAPTKVSWLFNALIVRRSIPKTWMTLIPYGTASNEPLPCGAQPLVVELPGAVPNHSRAPSQGWAFGEAPRPQLGPLLTHTEASATRPGVGFASLRCELRGAELAVVVRDWGEGGGAIARCKGSARCSPCWAAQRNQDPGLLQGHEEAW